MASVRIWAELVSKWGDAARPTTVMLIIINAKKLKILHHSKKIYKMKQIKLSQLQQNKGQIPGLPSNPRRFTDAEIERLAKSIEETPELLEARPLIVVKHEKKYIVLGGNMRHAALKHLNRETAPCEVLDEGLPISKLKEIVMKDNSSFGQWGTDALANEWSYQDLEGWGVKHIAGLDADGYSGTNTELDVDEFSEDMVMKFRLTKEQHAAVSAFFAGKDRRVELLKLCNYGK